MWWVWLLGIIAAGYVIHRTAVWAEGRGWIYYRSKTRPPGAAGMALLHMAQIVQPEIEYVIEEIQSQEIRAEVTRSGEGYEPKAD